MKKENKFVFSKKKILNKHLALNEKTLEKLMSGERGWILITHVRFCKKIKGKSRQDCLQCLLKKNVISAELK